MIKEVFKRKANRLYYHKQKYNLNIVTNFRSEKILISSIFNSQNSF